MRSTGPARANPIRARACSRRARHFLVRCVFPCRPIPKMPAAFECVLDIKASLGECPVWSVDEQVLYWVDINAPSLNRFDPHTGRNAAWAMPSSIGCFALRRSGGFIAALRDGFWLVDRNGNPERKVADAPYDPAHHRFNDGRADARGRFWAGSMNEKRDASTAKHRVFAHFAGEGDRPDGGAVDREGCYWSAFYRGGKSVRISPRGETLS